MINEIFIGTVSTFVNGEVDKNGLEPVIISPVLGRCPNRNVLSGTIAQNLGIEAGKTYLFNVSEIEPDPEYGRRFIFTKLKELTAQEIIESVGKLKPRQLITVDEVEEEVQEPKNTKVKL